MNIRKFEFLPFNEWYNTRRNGYFREIGDYTCALDILWWGPVGKETYMLAIAACDNPINIYVEKAVVEIFEYDGSDINKLKDWYEKVTVDINEKWEHYILENYFNSYS